MVVALAGAVCDRSLFCCTWIPLEIVVFWLRWLIWDGSFRSMFIWVGGIYNSDHSRHSVLRRYPTCVPEITSYRELCTKYFWFRQRMMKPFFASSLGFSASTTYLQLPPVSERYVLLLHINANVLNMHQCVIASVLGSIALVLTKLWKFRISCTR